MDKSVRNFFIVVTVAMVAFGYSLFKKGDLAGNFLFGLSNSGKRIEAEHLAMKQLPLFSAQYYNKKGLFESKAVNGPLVVHFFASWCAPCIQELPKLLSYANNQRQRSFLLIASKDKINDLSRLMRKLEVPGNVIVLLDPDVSIMDLFGSERVPESFFFDSSLNLDYKIEGTWEWKVQ